MKKSWLYKQKNYRDSAWNQFQQILAFDIIPFGVIAFISVVITLGIMSPIVLLIESFN